MIQPGDTEVVINDPVNHPSHYTGNGIECIDAIESALGPDGFQAFCRGCIIKYSWRSGKKGASSEDMAKAAWYAKRATETTNLLSMGTAR